MGEVDPRAAEVVDFWRSAGPEAWFRKNDEFDAGFHDRFRELHFAAARRELDRWIDHPESALALMILLDQFPRNCFRGTGHMYATDPLARHFAQKALVAGHDKAVEKEICVLLLPALLTFRDAGRSPNRGRTRHSARRRNAEACCRATATSSSGSGVSRTAIPILARETTPEEKAFLDGGGFAG